MEKKLSVLFAAFEAVPFMKTGGLGDVIGSLPQALKKAGCNVRVIMPKFDGMPEEYKQQLTHVTDFYVPLGWRSQYCGIEKLTYKSVIYYFIDNEYYFKRDKAYGYFDDGERVAFFARAVVEAIGHIKNYHPDILHCHDWHTALSPVYLRECYRDVKGYGDIKTVFTVHNLKFQGQMSESVLGDVLGLADIPAAADQLRSGNFSVNYMKGALCYSDMLSTVSPTYAWEIQRPFFGEQMDDIFRRRSSVLRGILNGIDTAEYDPAKDKLIAENFSQKDMSGKAACKKALQEELGLEVRDDVPLMVMVTRLTEQKGMDLVQRVMDEMLRNDIQIAVLGTGDRNYEEMLRFYAWKYPGKMNASITFNEALSHRMYAGADMFLMPSLFEPCGLSQMISMRYGTLPIVRETGGLKDSVEPYNQYTGEGTGFSFANYNAHEMLYTVNNACELYHSNREAFDNLVKNAMAQDFSWKRAALEYIDMYNELCPRTSEE